MAPKTSIKETYLVTVERKRTVDPEAVQEDICKAIQDNCLCKLVSVVNQDDILRDR